MRKAEKTETTETTEDKSPGIPEVVINVGLTPEDANICLELMRAGVKTAIESNQADAAIDGYTRVRNAFIKAANTTPGL